MEFTMVKPPVIFEYLIHLLELSVVFGIGTVIYITKKHPKRTAINNSKENTTKVELEAPEAPAELAMFKQDQ